MKAIDSAKAHYKSLEVLSTEVPQWCQNGNPLEVYYTPMTLAEKNKLFKYAKDDDLEIMAYAVILKCLDADGNKLFDLGDKRALMTEVDSDVVAELAAKLMNGVSVEDQAGN